MFQNAIFIYHSRFLIQMYPILNSLRKNFNANLAGNSFIPVFKYLSVLSFINVYFDPLLTKISISSYALLAIFKRHSKWRFIFFVKNLIPHCKKLSRLPLRMKKKKLNLDFFYCEHLLLKAISFQFHLVEKLLLTMTDIAVDYTHIVRN